MRQRNKAKSYNKLVNGWIPLDRTQDQHVTLKNRVVVQSASTRDGVWSGCSTGGSATPEEETPLPFSNIWREKRNKSCCVALGVRISKWTRRSLGKSSLS